MKEMKLPRVDGYPGKEDLVFYQCRANSKKICDVCGKCGRHIFKKKLLISRFLRWFCSRAPVNITNPYAKQFTQKLNCFKHRADGIMCPES